MANSPLIVTWPGGIGNPIGEKIPTGGRRKRAGTKRTRSRKARKGSRKQRTRRAGKR